MRRWFPLLHFLCKILQVDALVVGDVSERRLRMLRKIRGASQLAIAMTFAERGAGFYAEGQVDVQVRISVHRYMGVARCLLQEQVCI